jgi:hypothetical protein
MHHVALNDLAPRHHFIFERRICVRQTSEFLVFLLLNKIEELEAARVHSPSARLDSLHSRHSRPEKSPSLTRREFRVLGR